jgi:hypothetical protein
MTTETAATPAVRQPKREVISYYVVVKGVFGRNRTAKLQVFDLLQDCDPMDLPPQDMVETMMMDLLGRIKLKRGVAVLKEQPETIEDMGEFKSRCYVVFSDTKLVRLDRSAEGVDTFTRGGL